jgi:uncharacterized protein (DUF362 family)
MKSRVYVDALKRTDVELARQFDDAALAIGLTERVRTVKTLFIKPNLTYPVYKKGVTTRVEFVRALTEALLRANPRLKIFIGEGEGGYNSFSMSDAMHTMGFSRIADEHGQVEIINLSKVPTRTVELETLKGPYNIALPEVFFTEIDCSISCPLPKIHCMTTLTLSLKNLWGCLPDVMRLKNHYMFPHIVSQIYRLLKFEYAFLDGKYGLDSNGPMDGSVVEVNWFVASNSLGAFDASVSELMGFDWRKIPHLRVMGSYGCIPQRSDVEVIGELGPLRRKFHLKREFWSYPALAAFGSKHLTHFFYFSRYADLMHDVMYTFRKRPISLLENKEV